jgi:hypothetical protein
MIISSTFHRVFCNFWQGVSFQFFGSKSTLLQQQLQDTHLTNGFTGVFGFHRRSPFTPPASAPPCVAHTLKRALCPHRRVDVMFALPAFHRDRFQCFWASPMNPAAERLPLGSACAPCAVVEGSHPAFLCTSAVYFIVFMLFFWAYLLLPSSPVNPCFDDWVFVTQFTCDTHSLVTSALWHPCLKSKGPHLRKHYSRVLTFIGLFLGCPSPAMFVFFIFCCNRLFFFYFFLKYIYILYKSSLNYFINLQSRPFFFFLIFHYLLICSFLFFLIFHHHLIFPFLRSSNLKHPF